MSASDVTWGNVRSWCNSQDYWLDLYNAYLDLKARDKDEDIQLQCYIKDIVEQHIGLTNFVDAIKEAFVKIFHPTIFKYSDSCLISYEIHKYFYARGEEIFDFIFSTYDDLGLHNFYHPFLVSDICILKARLLQSYFDKPLEFSKSLNVDSEQIRDYLVLLNKVKNYNIETPEYCDELRDELDSCLFYYKRVFSMISASSLKTNYPKVAIMGDPLTLDTITVRHYAMDILSQGYNEAIEACHLHNISSPMINSSRLSKQKILQDVAESYITSSFTSNIPTHK